MEQGSRTVISVFEYYALEEPDRVWALRPKDSDNLTAGFESITYKACMNAVNHAVQWLQQALPASGKAFDAFAYQGPSDLRVSLLCLAAAKLRKQILLPQRRMSPPAQCHLITTAACVALVHAKGTDPVFDCKEAGVATIVAPELSEWTGRTTPANVAPFSGSWMETQNDPWILLHTSGTTGLPKVVPVTHKHMAKMDDPLPKKEGRTTGDVFGTGSWFTTIPLFHFVGLVIGFQFAPLLGGVFIIPPMFKGPPVFGAKQLIDLIHHAKPYGMVMPPADIEKLASSDEGMVALTKVQCVNFVGAQLRKSVGDRLMANGNTVIYGLGTTEAGGYPQLIRGDKEWDWFTFPEAAGATFEHYPGSEKSEEVYELVFYKNKTLERGQGVFLAFPDQNEFRTKDLFYKHLTLKNTWKIAGRSDDFFKQASGLGILATPVEEAVLERGHHVLDAVLMAGHGREHPCLLVSPKAGADRDSFLDRLWPSIEAVNETLQEPVRIGKDMVIVAEPGKPFLLNGKGAVSRRDTLLAYEKEIADLYSDQ